MAVTVKPVVHLNGTSKELLLMQVRTAMEAVGLAQTALCAAAPNGRDYYPISDTAINVAVCEHRGRLTKLDEVFADLETLAVHLMESGS